MLYQLSYRLTEPRPRILSLTFGLCLARKYSCRVCCMRGYTATTDSLALGLYTFATNLHA